MTNPTSPLTAEERFRLAKIWDMSDASMSQLNAEDDISFLLCLVRKMELAAQQNAELVAENERLAKCLKLNSDLAMTAAQHVEDLQAENERLKQQVITLRDAIAKRLSQADDEGFCLLKAYNDTQPPKTSSY